MLSSTVLSFSYVSLPLNLIALSWHTTRRKTSAVVNADVSMVPKHALVHSMKDEIGFVRNGGSEVQE